jgi:starvation-inducible DNA-binding protein
MASKTAQPKKSDRSNHSSSRSRALATPTDLTPEQVRTVTEAINPIIADAVALFMKAKNFHWHLVGSHYRDYHILFDEHAEQLMESLDPLAERVRRIGGTTLRSVGHVQALTGIDDDDDDLVLADQMIERLLDDNLHIAKQMRAAIELTQENRDHPTSDLLIDLLDATEKRIWFLHEISQGGSNMR